MNWFPGPATIVFAPVVPKACTCPPTSAMFWLVKLSVPSASSTSYRMTGGAAGGFTGQVTVCAFTGPQPRPGVAPPVPVSITVSVVPSVDSVIRSLSSSPPILSVWPLICTVDACAGPAIAASAASEASPTRTIRIAALCI